MNKNDVVYTPRHISKKIIEHFQPSGKILEPCSGDGAFLDFLPTADWCEIQKNKDFFTYNKKVDWIISNPPFSTYDDFLKHSFKIANNVVYLIPLYKTFKSLKYMKMVEEYGGIKEICIIGSGASCDFNMGFLVGCVYYKKNYTGDIKLTNL